MVVYFAFFGLSVAPFFDVMAAPGSSEGKREGHSILSKYALNKKLCFAGALNNNNNNN